MSAIVRKSFCASLLRSRARVRASILCLLGILLLAGCSSGSGSDAAIHASGAPSDMSAPERDASSAQATHDGAAVRPTATQRDAAPSRADGATAPVADSAASQPADDAASPSADAAARDHVLDAAVGVYPAATAQHLTVGAHDPSLLSAPSGFYLFTTGGRLSIRRSQDLGQWTDVGSVFAAQPAWIGARLGQAPADLWAPDVSYRDGVYYLYYAGSALGSNHSVIGLASNRTLDQASADYRWQDQGLILESNPSGQKDDWNAIDPSSALDESGQPWLVFGSFWSGIKLRRLDALTGKLAESDSRLYALAAHSDGGIEAPSIVEHGGYYYLFVSYDVCCKGAQSTYRTMVGRAEQIVGPYLDRAGGAMLDGKAEQLLATDGRYIGPGGGTAYRDGDSYYYVYHYYDGQAAGASFAMLRPISWTDDHWPSLGSPLWQ